MKDVGSLLGVAKTTRHAKLHLSHHRRQVEVLTPYPKLSFQPCVGRANRICYWCLV
jgi:hypothetical protein